jgi:protein-S-isoprenylcysteine O-methyltransferase Ste14
MVKNHLILTCMWIAFCVMHSILAADTVKQGIRKNMGKIFPRYRLWYILLAFTSAFLVVLFEVGITTTTVFTTGPLLQIAGILTGAAGAVIMAASIRKYFPRFSGMLKDQNKTLFTAGLNRYVRHPLYLGTFICIWGAFLALPYWSLFISNSIITVYTLIGIRFEEKKLENEFGGPYITYRKKVPKIIPTFRKDNG